MPKIAVKLHKTYDGRILDLKIALGVEKPPEALDPDVRRFRHALAEAVQAAFTDQGHRLEELQNFERDRYSVSHGSTNILRAKVQLIGAVKRPEFLQFSALLLQALERSGHYQVQVVRGVSALYE